LIDDELIKIFEKSNDLHCRVNFQRKQVEIPPFLNKILKLSIFLYFVQLVTDNYRQGNIWRLESITVRV